MNGKKIFITGGTGSWGKELLKLLLKSGVAQIKIYSRNECNMVTLKEKFKDERIQIVIGDIRDKDRLMKACKGCDYIFHLAAIKHVTICEQMPTEAIQTNVIGTQNVIDCAIANKVEKVIYASTDKAITPHCTYGCTKLLGEKLILAANAQSTTTKFMIFRSGNLLGSSGSVIPLFQRQIAQGGMVDLTHKKMHRFFISIPQAAKMLAEAALRGAGGEVFLPRMNSLAIYDVAKYLLEKEGLNETSINVTGIRPGEKLDEYMATKEESQFIYKINDDLYTLMEKDNHSWAANGFIKASSSYPLRSDDAVISYKEVYEFLHSSNI